MSVNEGKWDGQQNSADRQMTAPPPTKSRSWIVWLSIFLLLVVIVGIMAVIHENDMKAAAAKKAQAAIKPPVTATVAAAKTGNQGVYLEAIGTVTPVYTASITAQASGVLTAVHYTEGQFVQKGDDLIDIDPRPYEAQLLEAEGTLEKDTNILAQAQMDLERYRTAWAHNGINKQLLDDQEKIVLQDQGQVKNDQGTVNYDTVQLSYCHITAPISGRVGLRLVDPGNVVQAGGTNVLVVVAQEQPITVVFTLAEDSLSSVLARMKQMHTLPVEAWDRAQDIKLASGKLQSIDNQIDTATGTVKLRAQFDNRNGALFPNQFVNTRLLLNTVENATLIPSGAVQHNGTSTFSYVVANGVASVRTIEAGVTDSGMTAVTGLNPGELVATSSFDKLQAGSKVILSKQAIPSNPSGGNTP
ncbi:MAG: efflux RND transporter periplasmic adaptor subunit [Terracidiphilus sp.]|jgi:multidrug efflux system membrane fusion protein